MAARMRLTFARNFLNLARIIRVFGPLDVRPLPVVCAHATQRKFCSGSGEEKEKISDKLAKPGGAKAKRNVNIAEVNLNKISTAEKSPLEEGIAPELVSAVDSVAKSLKHDPDVTRSDLLQKLQEHNTTTKSTTKQSSVSSLFAGMTVDKHKTDKSRRPDDVTGFKERSSSRSDSRVIADGGEGFDRRPRRDQLDRRRARSGVMEDDEEQAKRSEQYRQYQRQRWEEGPTDGRGGDRRFPRRVVPDITLFDGPAMGIFTKQQQKHKGSVSVSDPSQSIAVQKSLSIFDELEQEEMHKMMSMPPSNAFEEMIRWTREGKLWQFPIDNDQGSNEEAQVGFHEHIFLEHLLDAFPKKGPVRHFMELVVVGLSHNPYYTVKEKHDHIAWFSNYFKDKHALIEESQAASIASLEGAEQLKI